ncbi:MAG: hypothetical protein KL787_03960 [Taibaiella sp.]|nr:hypothetical protein [Taibaiella sp.]
MISGFRMQGLNMTAGYKINTANPYDYYYGNRFSGQYAVFITNSGSTNQWMIAPNAGIQYEHSMKDMDGAYRIRPDRRNGLLWNVWG